MTEKQYQDVKKVMQQASYLKGHIAKTKSEVSKWTRIEGAHRENMRVEQADGSKKILLKTLEKLDNLRKKFEDLKL